MGVQDAVRAAGKRVLLEQRIAEASEAAPQQGPRGAQPASVDARQERGELQPAGRDVPQGDVGVQSAARDISSVRLGSDGEEAVIMSQQQPVDLKLLPLPEQASLDGFGMSRAEIDGHVMPPPPAGLTKERYQVRGGSGICLHC